MKRLAVWMLGTTLGFVACGGDSKTSMRGGEGGAADAGAGGADSLAGSVAAAGKNTTGGPPSGSAGESSGGVDSGSGGDAGGAGGAVDGGSSSIGGSAESGAAGQAGESTGGAAGCEIGEAQSPAAPGSLDLFGQIAYFGSADPLPAGRYRVSYVDGCMKYASDQAWAIHAYADGSIAWWLGTASGDKLVMPPGTVGIFAEQGGYADFDACVAANSVLTPVEFDFAGGTLGIWLADSNYGDNLSGVNGRNPSWKLTLLSGSCD